MTPDLAGLRAAYQTDPNFKLLLDLCGQKRPRQVVRVELLCGRCRGNFPLDRAEVLRQMARLSTLGLGNLLQPARRDRARFAWRIRATEALNLARHPGGTLTAAAFHLGEPVELAAPPPPDDGLSRQTVPLSPGRAAQLVVPEDLTEEEGEWLGRYLARYARAQKAARSLPAEPHGE